jgi:hypothetical protein
MKSSQHAPYVPGYKRTTMGETMRYKPAKGSKPQKLTPSSDCRLKLVCMKADSLVIVGQLYNGEYVLRSCTHRPSHYGSLPYPKPLP